jgi:hypothetical protein
MRTFNQLKILTFTASLFSLTSFSFAGDTKFERGGEPYKPYFSTKLVRNAGKTDSVVVLRATGAGKAEEYFLLRINDRVVGPPPLKNEGIIDAAARDVFELVERDWNTGATPLTVEQKLDLCVELVKFSRTDKTLIKQQMNLTNEKIIERGKLTGYFNCEKAAYKTLNIPTYSKATILQPIVPK